jgi:hypothetical protein
MADISAYAIFGPMPTFRHPWSREQLQVSRLAQLASLWKHVTYQRVNIVILKCCAINIFFFFLRSDVVPYLTEHSVYMQVDDRRVEKRVTRD